MTVTAAMLCGYCERPSDLLVTYADGVSICMDCRRKERARLGACGECGYGLPWHIELGRCPTESEARDRSGAQSRFSRTHYGISSEDAS